MSRTPLVAHGLRLLPQDGWSATITLRDAGPGETPAPLLHAATFPLPRRRGDFGSGAAAIMGRDDVLLVLMEYGAESAGRPLFAAAGLPKPSAAQFSPGALQRTLPGQSGYQRFFTWNKRPFCLYTVLGSHSNRARLVPRLHQMLAGITVVHGSVTPSRAVVVPRGEA